MKLAQGTALFQNVQAADPYRGLMAGVVMDAIQRARKGDVLSATWLVEEGYLWVLALGIWVSFSEWENAIRDPARRIHHGSRSNVRLKRIENDI